MARPPKKSAPKRRGGGAARKPVSKSDSKKRNGGRRPGAGRPRKPEPRFLPGSEIDANKVGELARLGTDRETIVVALRVPRELLSDPGFVLAFDDAVGFGKAWLEIDMLEERRSLVREGKVSANLAGLRHFKKWGDRGVDPGKVNHQAAFSDLEQVIKKVGRRR